MRIDALSQVSQLYGANGVKKTNAPVKTSATDKVEISSFGRELQIAKQAVKESPDIRQDKVNDLKNQINNGTYNVSPESFANKILSGF
jgi:negative regulator of flagellin synthesis FlgM